MKKLLVLPFLIFLVAAGVFLWGFQAVQAPSATKTSKRIIVPRGLSAIQIGQRLRGEGIIKSPFAFKLFTQLSGSAAKIQAGEYNLATNLNLFDLISALLRGPDEVWVTIPEGLRREEIAERFSEAFDNPSFGEEFLTASKGKEGYLFPDTYLFAKTASGSAVVATMSKTFESRVDFEISREEMIIASILERETVTEEERPIVAGILLKRWRAGWALQADATVQYALGEPGDWWPRPLSREDLQINSPYNTYRFASLPPTPISNPGLSSIKAAVNPEESPYWFYLHDSEGRVHYARTLEEHNENIRNYLSK